jgi:hypothetical protein
VEKELTKCIDCAFGECGNDPTLDPSYPDPAAGGYKGKLQCGKYQPTNVISISVSPIYHFLAKYSC